MRRRPPAADDPSLPPAHLQTLTGVVTTREKLAWLRARERWWEDTQGGDSGGWLPWLLDSWDQIGDLPFCGSVGGDPCGDVECLCGIPADEQ